MPSEDTQFREGNEGGPGRPSFRDMIIKVGSEMVEHDGIQVTRTEKAVIGAFKFAMSDDAAQAVPALKFLAQHSEGTKSEEKKDVTLTVVVKDETIDIKPPISDTTA